MGLGDEVSGLVVLGYTGSRGVVGLPMGWEGLGGEGREAGGGGCGGDAGGGGDGGGGVGITGLVLSDLSVSRSVKV